MGALLQITGDERGRDRRCRRRTIAPGSPRPSMLLAAWFAPAIAMLIAAAATAIARAAGGPEWLHWLSLHLALLGGVSQLILGASQFFVCAALATDPPPLRLLRAQLASWNGGTALVAVGVPTSTAPLADAGAALVLIGLVLFALALRWMQGRSLQRAPWAARWYLACAACLAIGALVGALMARGTVWTYGSLLGAHLALNLAGWLGMAIVGTLHTFFPSITQTRLRYQRLQQPTFWLWLAGVAALAAGAAGGSDAGVACGWALLLASAACLGTNLVASLRAADTPLTLPARLISFGQAFLAAALVLALVTTVQDGLYAAFAGQARGALAALLLAGWVGLTVAGALLHLLAVLARVRRFTHAMPAPRRARDGVLSAAAALAVAGFALSHAGGLGGASGPFRILLVAVTAVLAAQVLRLAVRALLPSGYRSRSTTTGA